MGLHVSITKLWISFLIVTAILAVSQLIVASGEQSDPKVVLLRLEDIGPGGEYGTVEQLGKLRAVLDLFREQGIRYQIGLIPKWVNYSDQGLSYNRSVDQTGDPYVQAFLGLMKEAERSGAVIGMHGYTHQAGETKRQDGHQESGIGNEFDVRDLPVTATAPYSEARVKEGLRLFDAAGLRPAFWESPHYHSTLDQHRVFRSYFGIIYENSPENPKQSRLAVYPDRNRGPGEPSWGGAYVPTPYSFIPYNRDEKLILNQLNHSDSDRLPSFFYHAFLEFKHLIPVLDGEGKPVLRDGLPEYRYTERSKSNMQKLIAAFKERGYRFYSMYDYVPFTPSAQMGAEAAGNGSNRGDVTGDGQLDAVVWKESSGAVSVYPGQFKGMRNDPHPRAESWASIPCRKGDVYSLRDEDGDGLDDLWVLRAAGQVEVFKSTGSRFVPAKSWKLPAGPVLEELFILKRQDHSFALAGRTDKGTRLAAYAQEGGAWKAVEPVRGRTSSFGQLHAVHSTGAGADQMVYCRRGSAACTKLELPPGKAKWQSDRQNLNLPYINGVLRLGDFNGDGLLDAMSWDKDARAVTVYRQSPGGSFAKLSEFGPWGEPGAKPVLADFDGNGKLDLAAQEPDGALDIALSFQPAE